MEDEVVTAPEPSQVVTAPEPSQVVTAPEPSQVVKTPESSQLTREKRKELLAQAIQSEVVAGGRVQSQSEFSAVVVSGKSVNHTLHAILTLFTAGVWGIVWIILAITGGEKRTMVSIDEFGNILRQNV